MVSFGRGRGKAGGHSPLLDRLSLPLGLPVRHTKLSVCFTNCSSQKHAMVETENKKEKRESHQNPWISLKAFKDHIGKLIDKKRTWQRARPTTVVIRSGRCKTWETESYVRTDIRSRTDGETLMNEDDFEIDMGLQDKMQGIEMEELS